MKPIDVGDNSWKTIQKYNRGYSLKIATGKTVGHVLIELCTRFGEAKLISENEYSVYIRIPYYGPDPKHDRYTTISVGKERPK